jgi:hypothetical protein
MHQKTIILIILVAISSLSSLPYEGIFKDFKNYFKGYSEVEFNKDKSKFCFAT